MLGPLGRALGSCGRSINLTGLSIIPIYMLTGACMYLMMRAGLEEMLNMIQTKVLFITITKYPGNGWVIFLAGRIDLLIFYWYGRNHGSCAICPILSQLGLLIDSNCLLAIFEHGQSDYGTSLGEVEFACCY